MNINKYTEKAQEAILAAQQLADREGHPEITPEHLLLTLLEQRDGIVPSIVRKMNADPAALAAAVRTELGRAPRAHGGAQPSLSARLRRSRTPPSRKPSGSRTSTSAPNTCSSRSPARAGTSPAARLLQQQRHHARRDPPGADGGPRLAARHQSRTRRRPTSRSNATAATSPSWPARASSIRSSAATTRSAASSRCCRAAPRTTRS